MQRHQIQVANSIGMRSPPFGMEATEGQPAGSRATPARTPSPRILKGSDRLSATRARYVSAAKLSITGGFLRWGTACSAQPCDCRATKQTSLGPQHGKQGRKDGLVVLLHYVDVQPVRRAFWWASVQRLTVQPTFAPHRTKNAVPSFEFKIIDVAERIASCAPVGGPQPDPQVSNSSRRAVRHALFSGPGYSRSLHRCGAGVCQIVDTDRRPGRTESALCVAAVTPP